MKKRSQFFFLFLGILFHATLFVEVSVAQITSEIKSITVKEGTNMAVALSPDKEMIAIDLQGRLWTLPSTGGAAVAITDSLGDARQPAWSPDGNQLCFQGYWEGNWHIYTVHKTGENLEQWTSGDYDNREPHWSPDGKKILFSSDQAGTYDIWTIEVATKKLEQLTDGIANEYAPAWAPSGNRFAYISDAPDKEGIHIVPIAVQHTKTKSRWYAVEGKIAGLSWRPDGTSLVFNKTTFSESSLWIQRLDMPEAIRLSKKEEVVFPFRVTWASNLEYIYTGDGKINRKNIGFKQESIIPFSATFSVRRDQYAKKKRDFDSTEEQVVKGIVNPVISPGGKRVAFIAMNDLWVRQEDGTCRNLTKDASVELAPVWSPDGKEIAYVGDKMGKWGIWRMNVETGFHNRKLVIKGNPSNFGLAWSPDGKEIAYSLGIHPRLGQLNVWNLQSGKSRKISKAIPSSIGAPTWSADSEVVAISTRQAYSTLYREGINRLLFFSKDGSSNWRWKGLKHWSLGSRRKDGPIWSPDGKYMAAISKGLLWVIPVDLKGQPTGEPIPVSTVLADAPSWSDGTTLLYQTLDGLKKVNISTLESTDISIDLTWSRPINKDTTVIHIGSLYDGVNASLKKDMDIVIVGNRITEIASHQTGRPATKFVDASAAYAVPGLIDIHAHQGSWAGEKLGRQWLAWGVTATRDPATVALDALNRREATQSGKYIGPRIFFTGSPIDGNRIYYADAIAQQAPEQLEMELAKAEKLDYDMLKTYVRLADAQQQKVVEKAHELGIPVSSHELYPAVAYSTDGVEHIAGTSRRGYSPKLTSLLSSYGDVSSLIAESGMSFTPTVGIYVSYNYLLSKDTSILSDERLEILETPFSIVNAKRGIKQVKEDPEGWEKRFTNACKMIKDIHQKGGLISAGTDGPILPFGFGLHMELEAYQTAGLSPYEVLQTVTINNAKVLGTEKDMGTIEVGKLADILIVKKNPLEDIKYLRAFESVIANGILYQLEDLLVNQNPYYEVKKK